MPATMTSATYSCDTRGRLRQDRPWPATYPLPLIATLRLAGHAFSVLGQIIGTQLALVQLVPHTTVSPSSVVPHTTVSSSSVVPQTTVSPSSAVPQTTVSPPVVAASTELTVQGVVQF